MQWVRLPIQGKKNIRLFLFGCADLVDIQGMEGLSNHGWIISYVTKSKLSNNYKKSLVEALCYGGYGYQILFNCCYTFNHRDKFSMIPNWFSCRGEGCSLSFRIPPVFEGLAIWAVCSGGGCQEYEVIIKNKRNGIPLFEATHARPYFPGRWVIVISKPEIAMEEYCGDGELELHVILRSENSEVVRCGIHVIKTHPFGRSIYDEIPALSHDICNQESFEGSEGDHDMRLPRDFI
uniref:Uncharacterized protein n=1 Tax=Populus davidiana TaxID=266767 RepID=A0A6M2E7A8_9ROSI